MKSGFSTIEFIISLSFIGIVIYGGLSMLTEQKVEVIEANQKIEITALTYEIREALQNRESCSASFSGLPPNTDEAQIESLKIYSDTNISGQQIQTRFNNSEINELTKGQAQLSLKGYGFSDRDQQVSKEQQSTHLIISFDKGPLFENSRRYTNKKIKIFYEMSENNEISTCGLSPRSKSSTDWVHDETQNVLYTEKKRLGVETNSPQVELDINGPLLLQPTGAQRPTCDLALQGTLISQGRHNRSYFCDSRLWRPLIL